MLRIKTFLFFTPYFLLLTLITSCSNKAKTDDSLKKYFDDNKVEGSFELLNNKNGEITVYNLSLDTQRVLPATSFEIANSLIGIETGKIVDEKMVIKWDGIKRPNQECNKDMDMEEAFKVSCVPYFQEVARRIGKDTMQLWLDSLHYGNATIDNYIDSFWLDNSLKISPDEQLGLINHLYFDQLPFQRRTQQIVRDAMLQDDNTLYKLSYKTGWGIDEKNNLIGWIIGWVEENKHPYFFVVLIKSPDLHIDMQKISLTIAKDILKQYGFFEGKM